MRSAPKKNSPRRMGQPTCRGEFFLGWAKPFRRASTRLNRHSHWGRLPPGKGAGACLKRSFSEVPSRKRRAGRSPAPAERPFRKLSDTGGTSRKGFLHNPFPENKQHLQGWLNSYILFSF
jgi:hypothetical protein